MDATYQTSLAQNPILVDGRESSTSRTALQQRTPRPTEEVQGTVATRPSASYAFNEGWTDPARQISCLRKGINVVKSLGISLGGMLHLLYLRLCCCLPPLQDDKAITTRASYLPREGRFEHTRILLNHSELLWPNDRTDNRKAITQPPLTENFLLGAQRSFEAPREPQSDEEQYGKINLAMPPQCGADLKASKAIQNNFRELSRGLEEAGFVAYKNGMLLLHPKAHVCCALIYDKKLRKIFLHFRDTASNDFWEKNCGKHNWRANFGQGLGLLPRAYSVADMLVYNLKQAFAGIDFTVVGYSMGGGLAIFSALRNSTKAIGINPAFPSKMHKRFYPAGWAELAPDNISAISTSNDLLSRVADNPATGGILPTQFPAGSKFYIIDGPKQEEMGCLCRQFKESLEAHFIPNLVSAYLYLAYSQDGSLLDPELAAIIPTYAWAYTQSKYEDDENLKTANLGSKEQPEPDKNRTAMRSSSAGKIQNWARTEEPDSSGKYVDISPERPMIGSKSQDDSSQPAMENFPAVAESKSPDLTPRVPANSLASTGPREGTNPDDLRS